MYGCAIFLSVRAPGVLIGESTTILDSRSYRHCDVHDLDLLTADGVNGLVHRTFSHELECFAWVLLCAALSPMATCAFFPQLGCTYNHRFGPPKDCIPFSYAPDNEYHRLVRDHIDAIWSNLLDA